LIGDFLDLLVALEEFGGCVHLVSP
jgi:hypothetical protein